MSDGDKRTIKRVHATFGLWVEDPKVCTTLSGPQTADQAHPDVLPILENPMVEMVLIKFKPPGQPMKVEIYQPIEGES